MVMDSGDKSLEQKSKKLIVVLGDELLGLRVEEHAKHLPSEFSPRDTLVLQPLVATKEQLMVQLGSPFSGSHVTRFRMITILGCNHFSMD